MNVSSEDDCLKKIIEEQDLVTSTVAGGLFYSHEFQIALLIRIVLSISGSVSVTG